MNQALAATIARRWPVNVCRFCGITEDQVDGDRVRWTNMFHNVCSGPGCVRRFELMVKQPKPLRRGKLTPGEVHRRIRSRRKRRAA